MTTDETTIARLRQELESARAEAQTVGEWNRVCLAEIERLQAVLARTERERDEAQTRIAALERGHIADSREVWLAREKVEELEAVVAAVRTWHTTRQAWLDSKPGNEYRRTENVYGHASDALASAVAALNGETEKGEREDA